MELKSSIGIARALIKRYGHQAQAIAEESADIMALQDPGMRHVWEQVPLAVCELRRTNAAQERQRSKQTS